MIASGQVLRQDYFRAPPAIGAGDSVRVVYTGEGFNISTSGRAIGNAAEGQPVRVQTEAGRIVQGIARAGRVVEMRL
jgi:flagella basal body P-ring formation protein FlgA